VENTFEYMLAYRFIWRHAFPLVILSNRSRLTIFAYRVPEKVLLLYQFTIL